MTSARKKIDNFIIFLALKRCANQQPLASTRRLQANYQCRHDVNRRARECGDHQPLILMSSTSNMLIVDMKSVRKKEGQPQHVFNLEEV